MVMALTPGKTWTWVHPSDRDLPEDEQTLWTFRTLTAAQHRRIANKAAASPHLSNDEKARGEVAVTEFRTGDYQYYLLKEGIEDVTNLRRLNEETGEVEPVPYSCSKVGTTDGAITRVNDKFLDLIPNEILLDAAAEIDKGNTLTEDDRKN